MKQSKLRAKRKRSDGLKHLAAFKNKKILILTHSGADVDAIAAAGCLSLALGKKNQVEVGVPEHISLPAKAFSRNTGIKYSISPKLKGFDCIFLVDLNELKMLGRLQQDVQQFKGPVYLIDHHTRQRNMPVKQSNAFIDSDAIGTVEIVYRMLKKSKIKITPKMAVCIAAGLVTDSAFFLNADSNMFKIMAEMLETSKKRFSSITGLFRVRRDFSEKIAMLKAAKRARIFRLGNYIAVISDVGAFEADAASALVRVGADVAFVGDIENGKLRISGRASKDIGKKTGLDLAEHVFQRLGGYVKGSGGGHAAAAGFRGNTKDLQGALMQCVHLTRSHVQKKGKSIQLKEYT